MAITQTPAALPLTSAGFEAFLATRSEPAWVTDQRRSALAVWEEKLETPLDPEEWKRVELRTFRPEQFSLQPAPSDSVSFETLLEDRAEFGGHVRHLNGVCRRAELSEELAGQGVLFGDLATMLEEHGDLLRPHLMTRAVRPDTDRFSAWHAAFWTGGTVLYVPRNVEVKAPLHSLIGLAGAGAADLSHT
ncbi:MAG: Fe-S cluster assembly protein SufD, partial [Planctomycetaceae bacterium]|nr:Fe-S cluster assembly protein SufD [Planctomycetaceae bacterium]